MYICGREREKGGYGLFPTLSCQSTGTAHTRPRVSFNTSNPLQFHYPSQSHSQMFSLIFYLQVHTFLCSFFFPSVFIFSVDFSMHLLAFSILVSAFQFSHYLLLKCLNFFFQISKFMSKWIHLFIF